MTKEESQAKTTDKVNAIEVLLRQLQVTVEAKQVVTEKGIIENMVFYRDNEKYKIDEPAVDEKAPAKEAVPLTKKEKND